MTHTFSTNTFAPKRTPWFGGFFALLILAVIAYAVILFMPTQTVAGQDATVVQALPAAPSPMVSGMESVTRALHVPSGYIDSQY